MSVITKFRRWLSGQEGSGCLGVALAHNSLAISQQSSDGEFSCQRLTSHSATFSDAIAQLVESDFSAGRANLILNAGNYQIVQVDKPNVPEQELNAALKWQVKDLVNYSPDQMIVDYFTGPVVAGSEKLHVVCAPKPLLQELVGQCNDAGLKLNHISIEEFAFVNLVPNSDDACLLLCQQPNEEVLLLIIKQGQLYFYRRLRGLAHIGNKTQEQLDAGLIDGLSLEVQRSTDYFERQLKQAPIKSIQVLLPIAQEAFIARRLAENSNVPVELLVLAAPYQNQRDYAVSIAALNLSQPHLSQIASGEVKVNG